MRKIKDVLRLKLDAKMSHQQIAAALGISKGVVTKYVGLAAAAGLDWTTVQDLDETMLERRLLAAPEQPRDHVQPDYGRLHHERLCRIKQISENFTTTYSAKVRANS